MFLLERKHCNSGHGEKLGPITKREVARATSTTSKGYPPFIVERNVVKLYNLELSSSIMYTTILKQQKYQDNASFKVGYSAILQFSRCVTCKRYKADCFVLMNFLHVTCS